MRRHFSKARNSENEIDSTMTPMIDVVFLLLVFFVWTASFRVVELVLPSQLSAESGDQSTEITQPLPEQDFDKIIVHVGWDGRQVSWRMNDVEFADIDSINRNLQSIYEVNPNAPVVVHPDRLAPLGFVIEAYDVATDSGFAKVSLAVNTAN